MEMSEKVYKICILTGKDICLKRLKRKMSKKGRNNRKHNDENKK